MSIDIKHFPADVKVLILSICGKLAKTDLIPRIASPFAWQTPNAGQCTERHKYSFLCRKFYPPSQPPPPGGTLPPPTFGIVDFPPECPPVPAPAIENGARGAIMCSVQIFHDLAVGSLVLVSLPTLSLSRLLYLLMCLYTCAHEPSIETSLVQHIILCCIHHLCGRGHLLSAVRLGQQGDTFWEGQL
jgi:hypothetical protein